MSEISDLLDASHRAHWRYHQHLPRMTAMPGGPVSVAGGDAIEARKALAEAADLRLQADAADPDHTDRAWIDEAAQFPHDELLQFYAQQLAIETAADERSAELKAQSIRIRSVSADAPNV